MSVLLAYALFILLMAAPFIAAAILIGGFLSGLSMIAKGLAAGNATAALGGLVLTLACVVGMIAAWHCGMRGPTSPAKLTLVSPVTAEMRARPLGFVLGLESNAREVLEVFGDTLDRVEGGRRYTGGSTKRGDRSIEEYSRWLDDWQLVTLVDRDALRRGDMAAATTLTILRERTRGPYFGIDRKYSPDRPNFQLSYHGGGRSIEISRCEVDLTPPPFLRFLPFGGVTYMFGDTYKQGMARLRACRREMLEKLAADLG